MKELGTLLSGETVYDRTCSHLHDSIVDLLPEIFSRVNATGRGFFVEEVNLGRIIGETVCIATEKGDKIVYAQRPNRKGLTRFVKDRKPENCESAVVILKKDDEQNYYILITAFIGRSPQPEPWDFKATEESLSFWESHAIVWGTEATMPGAETIECPWQFLINQRERNKVSAMAWEYVNKYYSNAPVQHQSAFVNSVIYLVTGYTGGCGGPSMREHLAGRNLSASAGSFTFAEASNAVEECCFGPLTEQHAKMLLSECCFNDAPGEVEEAKRKLETIEY